MEPRAGQLTPPGDLSGTRSGENVTAPSWDNCVELSSWAVPAMPISSNTWSAALADVPAGIPTFRRWTVSQALPALGFVPGAPLLMTPDRHGKLTFDPPERSA
jgi:hypothetical protein